MSGPTAFRPGGSSAEPSREKFALNPLIGVFLVITAAAAFLLNLRGHGEYDVSYAIGSGVGVLIFVGLIAGLTYVISKRSSNATNTAIAIVCLLWFAGNGVSKLSGRSQQNQAVIDQLQAQSEAIQAEQRAEFERTGMISTDAAKANQVLDQMAATAKQGTGEDARAVQISLEVVKGLTSVVASYEEKVKEAQSLGGLDGKGLENPADLDRRIRVWSDAGKLAKQMTTQTAGLEKDVSDALAAAGISSRARQGFMGGFSGDGKIQVMLEVRRQEETIIAGILEQLAVLKRTYGDWEYDSVKDTIVFQKEEDKESYLAAVDRMDHAAEAQAKAQERLVNMQSQKKK